MQDHLIDVPSNGLDRTLVGGLEEPLKRSFGEQQLEEHPQQLVDPLAVHGGHFAQAHLFLDASGQRLQVTAAAPQLLEARAAARIQRLEDALEGLGLHLGLSGLVGLGLDVGLELGPGGEPGQIDHLSRRHQGQHHVRVPGQESADNSRPESQKIPMI